MSDEDALATEVVRLAIQAAGPMNGNERAWLNRIADATPTIAAMLRPPLPDRRDDATTPVVTARKVLESNVFQGAYVRHEYEESSKRTVVYFTSTTTERKDADDDGVEHIRTEPRWTLAGRLMAAKIDSLEPGQEITVYRHQEQLDKTRTVRVLAHLVPGRKPQNPVTPAPASTPNEARAQASRSTGGADSSPAPPVQSSEEPNIHVPQNAGPHYEHVAKEMSQLTNTQKVAVRAMCMSKGLERWMDPADEDLDKVLLVIAEIGKKGK